MTLYWLLGLFAFAGALFQRHAVWFRSRLLWVAYGLFLVVLIGGRDQVGGDWYNYLDYYEYGRLLSFADALLMTDPAYGALNWLAGQLDWGVYGVNLLCALLFVHGLVRFALRQPEPWLLMLTATPYLIIVIGMGYTRQAVAIGFLLWALTQLEQGRAMRYLLLLSLGALFHKSAVLMLPLVFLRRDRGRWFVSSLVGVFGLLFAFVVFQDDFDALWSNYVLEQMESSGAGVRLAMNLLPAAVVLLYSRRLLGDLRHPEIYLWMAGLSFALIPFLEFASTAVDRSALYLIPMQLMVMSRLPLLAASPAVRTFLALNVMFYYGAVLWVWLNYADHAHAWLPYRNALF